SAPAIRTSGRAAARRRAGPASVSVATTGVVSRTVPDGTATARATPVAGTTSAATDTADTVDPATDRTPRRTTTELLNDVDQLVDLLEERIVAQLERRGLRFRDLF
ncbi:MAG: hypothetical protein IT196_27850, partial [Acidimicrobiales bacterium]|nr:hypothetical protein [Acidimicrobiales bacterium]